MNKIYSLPLILILFISSAYAHEDRILSIQPDGSIPEIPAAFGPVALKISGLGNPAPTVQFSSGTHRNNLPICVTRYIHTQQMKDVFVSGSWYHNESVLPYYVDVEFYEPGYVQGHPYNSSFKILFNLRTAQVIKLQWFVADPSGNGGQYRDVVLPKGCALSEHAA